MSRSQTDPSRVEGVSREAQTPPSDRIITIRYNPLAALKNAPPSYRVVEPHGEIMAVGLTKGEADNMQAEAEAHEFTVEVEPVEPLGEGDVRSIVDEALEDSYISATVTEREVPKCAHSELVTCIEYGIQAADAVLAQWGDRVPLSESDKNLIQWAEDAADLINPMYVDPRIDTLEQALRYILAETGEPTIGAGGPTGTLERIAAKAQATLEQVGDNNAANEVPAPAPALPEAMIVLAEYLRADDALRALPQGEASAAWRDAEAQYRAARTEARALLHALPVNEAKFMAEAADKGVARTVLNAIQAPRLTYESTGHEVKVGDVVTDFRGNKCTVTGMSEPRHPGSTGRVELDGAEFFPSVINAVWTAIE